MDESRNATCCQKAKDSEIALNPEAYDCNACELMPRLEGLWHENADAWKTYHLLCGRAVRDLHLEEWTLDRWTADWDPDRVIGLIDRLNVILSVLEPHGRDTQN